MRNRASRLRRRVVTVALTALLIVPAIPGGAGPDSGGGQVAASLDDPVAVAVELSQRAAPDGSVGVKVGTAAAFPDSLAAAQHQPDWPLLLTAPDTLDPRVRDEIVRLGATEATVLGGPGAISDTVVEDLEALGLAVTRLAGPTRTETAVAIADAGTADRFLLVRAYPSPDSSDTTQAFADSLAAGALAAIDGGYGILLTQSDALTGSTRTFLQQRQAATPTDITVVAVGGAGAISDTVLAEVEQITPNVTRLAGPTRAATATALAEQVDAPAGSILLDGRHPNGWAAGFAAAAYARTSHQPVVLTEGTTLPAETTTWLGRQDFATLLCGPSVDTGTCQQARAAIGAGPDPKPSPIPPITAWNFPDGTYTIVCGAEERTVTLDDGQWQDPRGPTYGVIDRFVVTVGDFDGDGTDEAAVYLLCSVGTSTVAPTVIGYESGPDGPVQQGPYFNEFLEGTEPGAGGDVLITSVPVYGPDDPLCCPSSREESRWRLTPDGWVTASR